MGPVTPPSSGVDSHRVYLPEWEPWSVVMTKAMLSSQVSRFFWGDLPPWVLPPSVGSCLQPLPRGHLLGGQKALGAIGEDTEQSHGDPRTAEASNPFSKVLQTLIINSRIF